MRRMSRTIFDIETDNLLDEMTICWCIVCRDVDTGEVSTFGIGEIDAALEHLHNQDELIGHNIIGFDLPALAKLYRFRFEGKVTDTLVMSRLIHTNVGEKDRQRNARADYIPMKLIGHHSLKAWGHRLGLLKGTYLEDHGFDHYSEEMLCYCVKDTEVTYALYHKLVGAGWDKRCLTLEHEFASCMCKMERNGICFDADKARQLYVKISQRKLELNDRLQEMFPPDKQIMKSTFWLADGSLYDTKKAAVADGHKDIEKGPHKVKLIDFNPASRDMIADRLKRLGWKPSEFTEEGKPKVDEGVLSTTFPPSCTEAVELLREFLLLVKRMGQLAEGRQAWMKAERGGRIYGRINTNGAITGRCTHSSPNMAQVPRVGSPYGAECRSLFRASEGHVLVGCDASGLELRCLAHYLYPYDKGDYTNKILEGDIHVENQKAAGLPTRDAAKTFIYAFLYGAGDDKIGKVIGKGRGAGRVIKETFLERLPALRELKACISNALSARDFLKGLDGRQLFIRSEHSALNMLLQSAGAVIMKQATVNLYNKLTEHGLTHGKEWAFVAHIHDEYQVEVLPDYVDLVRDEAINGIKSTAHTLNFRCPLDGETHTGRTWAETH